MLSSKFADGRNIEKKDIEINYVKRNGKRSEYVTRRELEKMLNILDLENLEYFRASVLK